MELNLGGAKPSKSAEATTGPKILVTVKGNKLTPSNSVIKVLGLKYEYSEEKGSSEILKKGNNFNMGTLGNDFIIYVDPKGYRIGKNGGVSAPDLVEQMLRHFNMKRADFMLPIPEKGGEPVARSFNVLVDLVPIELWSDAEGDVSFTEDDTHTEKVEDKFYKLTLGDLVYRGFGDAEDAEDATDASDETQEEAKPKSKKGKKA